MIITLFRLPVFCGPVAAIFQSHFELTLVLVLSVCVGFEFCYHHPGKSTFPFKSNPSLLRQIRETRPSLMVIVQKRGHALMLSRQVSLRHFSQMYTAIPSHSSSPYLRAPLKALLHLSISNFGFSQFSEFSCLHSFSTDTSVQDLSSAESA